jgi:hypothetical protein
MRSQLISKKPTVGMIMLLYMHIMASSMPQNLSNSGMMRIAKNLPFGIQPVFRQYDCDYNRNKNRKMLEHITHATFFIFMGWPTSVMPVPVQRAWVWVWVWADGLWVQNWP